MNLKSALGLTRPNTVAPILPEFEAQLRLNARLQAMKYAVEYCSRTQGSVSDIIVAANAFTAFLAETIA